MNGTTRVDAWIGAVYESYNEEFMVVEAVEKPGPTSDRMIAGLFLPRATLTAVRLRPDPEKMNVLTTDSSHVASWPNTIIHWIHPDHQDFSRKGEAAEMLDAAKRMDSGRLAAMRARDDLQDTLMSEAASTWKRILPPWAKAMIIAEATVDESDSMSDYFGSKTTRMIILGFSKHQRDLFPELRKAAGKHPETAHLQNGPAAWEHREKYSMGGGYYLHNGHRHSTGWTVRKISIGSDRLLPWSHTRIIPDMSIVEREAK